MFSGLIDSPFGAYRRVFACHRRIGSGDECSHARSPVVEGSVQYEYGEILRLQGEYIQAKPLLERAVTILRVCASSYDETFTLIALVRLHCQLGDREGAGAWRTQLHQLMNQQELPHGCRALATLAFAVYELLTGDYWRARADAEEGCLLAERYVIPSDRAAAAVVLGHARSGMEDWDAAATAYRQAVSIYKQVGNVALALEAQAGLVQVALAQGDRAQAQQRIEAILPMLNEDTCSGFYTPFFIWLTSFHGLAANQDPRAVAVLQRGHALLQIYAGAIPNDGLRRSFLQQVRAHRALQQAYAHGQPI
jgi:tetratricopeptide (TPR) repeat protein